MLAAFPVAHGVQRLQHPLAEARRLFEQLAHQVRRCVRETRQVRVALEVHHLVQQEQVLLDRRLVGHGDVLLESTDIILS